MKGQFERRSAGRGGSYPSKRAIWPQGHTEWCCWSADDCLERQSL